MNLLDLLFFNKNLLASKQDVPALVQPRRGGDFEKMLNLFEKSDDSLFLPFSTKKTHTTSTSSLGVTKRSSNRQNPKMPIHDPLQSFGTELQTKNVQKSRVRSDVGTLHTPHMRRASLRPQGSNEPEVIEHGAQESLKERKEVKPGVRSLEIVQKERMVKKPKGSLTPKSAPAEPIDDKPSFLDKASSLSKKVSSSATHTPKKASIPKAPSMREPIDHKAASTHRNSSIVDEAVHTKQKSVAKRGADRHSAHFDEKEPKSPTKDRLTPQKTDQSVVLAANSLQHFQASFQHEGRSSKPKSLAQPRHLEGATPQKDGVKKVPNLHHDGERAKEEGIDRLGRALATKGRVEHTKAPLSSTPAPRTNESRERSSASTNHETVRSAPAPSPQDSMLQPLAPNSEQLPHIARSLKSPQRPSKEKAHVERLLPKEPHSGERREERRTRLQTARHPHYHHSPHPAYVATRCKIEPTRESESRKEDELLAPNEAVGVNERVATTPIEFRESKKEPFSIGDNRGDMGEFDDSFHHSDLEESATQQARHDAEHYEELIDHQKQAKVLRLHIENTRINISYAQNRLNLTFFAPYSVGLEAGVEQFVHDVMQSSGFERYRVALKERERVLTIDSKKGGGTLSKSSGVDVKV